jgi:hypothetical protein
VEKLSIEQVQMKSYVVALLKGLLHCTPYDCSMMNRSTPAS